MIEHGKKARLTVTLSKDLVERLEKLAATRGGNVSAVVEECVAARVGTLEMQLRARQDPFVGMVLSELMKPENLERAARIVGEKGVEPLSVRERGLDVVKKGKKGAVR